MLTTITIIINDTGTGHLSYFYFNILELHLKTFLHSGQLIWEVFVLCKADCRLFSCRKFLTFFFTIDWLYPSRQDPIHHKKAYQISSVKH